MHVINAHLCKNIVTRVKISYIFHMLSYDYAEMNIFLINEVKVFEEVIYNNYR